MENIKLLKILLKDLSELEELISEKKENALDELEMEFLQTRVSGAKRMMQILHDREGQNLPENGIKEESQLSAIPEKQSPPEAIGFENEKEIIVEKVSEEEPKPVEGEAKIDEDQPESTGESEPKPELTEEIGEKLPEKKVAKEAGRILGDSFSKEKSVNDLIDSENSNLEHKLSNRPVESIKKSIGINDRFQYIRELFEGNAEKFVDAVAELDEKSNINEAVDYLKQNFKWQKNETSLKFINLVKRRFSNE